MTREEAEEYAKEMTYRDAINNLMEARAIPYRKATFIKVNELLKTLEQEPCGYAISREDVLSLPRNRTYTLAGVSKNESIDVDLIEALPPVTVEPCGDAISRDAVWDVMQELWGTSGELIDRLMALPTVTPQPKTGHWIEVTNGRGGHECNICHEYAPSYQDGAEYLAKYCPSCGAKMVEPQESEG